MTATTPAGTASGTSPTPTPATSGGGPAGGRPSPGGTPGPAHTGSAATRVLGLLALVAVGVLVLYGLVISPADREMADSVRIMYVHVPAATLLYVGCFITTVASGLWLWKRTPGWDALAESGAEVGLVFSIVTLFSGSLWGRPTWGTYWVWDARLTSTAVLTALLIGYLALRRLDLDPDARSTRAAVLGLLLVPNVIVVNRSVEWWRSIHQDSTLARLDPTIEGDMLVALMVGFLAMALVFTWLLVHRFRVAWLEQQADRVDLDAALLARRAEAADADPATGSATTAEFDPRAGSAPTHPTVPTDAAGAGGPSTGADPTDDKGTST
ncbi:MAG: cytochrome c biogenesis protein CcsA [Acidimicrobiales bacterium]|nr:cytochrome c biogenesis protein CcsA [Acidimicrobiales bacterium]